MGERVVQAGFRRIHDGQTFPSGPWHDVGVLPTENLDEYDQGFITNKNRFLTRDEAKRLLHAPIPGALHSENIPGMGHLAPQTQVDPEIPTEEE